MLNGQKLRCMRALTLIELIIAMVVASILAGMATVGFSAFFAVSDYEEATSFARSVVVAQQSTAVHNNGFTVSAKELGLRAANVHIVDGPATKAGQVSMAVGVDGSLAVSSWAAEGKCVEATLESPAANDVVFSLVEGFSCDAAALLAGPAK